MESNTFRSALFGGFSRRDVVNYIEKSAAEANGRIKALEQRGDQLAQENGVLREELAAAVGERDRLDGELREALAQLERQRAELEESGAKCAALEKQCGELTEKQDRLESEIALLRPKAEQFAAVKEGIAELELAARRRAEQYENEAHQRADAYAYATAEQVGEMLDNCRAQCDQFVATLNNTCATVSAELQKSAASVSSLPAAFDTLREDLTELGRQERK